MKRDPRGLVSGHRRRHLPEHLQHREERARLHPDPRRRPHLQDGLRRHDATGTCDHGADLTIAPHPGSARRSDRASASSQIDEDHRIIGFEEKPKHGNPMRSRLQRGDVERVDGHLRLHVPTCCIELLCQDADEPRPSHDFGKNIIPGLISHEHVSSPTTSATERQGRAATGAMSAPSTPTIEANMDLVAVDARVQPVRPTTGRSARTSCSCRRRSSSSPQEGRRMGVAIDSIVSTGCIVSGGRVIKQHSFARACVSTAIAKSIARF